MTDTSGKEPEIVHQLRNLLSIVVSFSDLLLLDFAEDDARRSDVAEIEKAARAALALMPKLTTMLE